MIQRKHLLCHPFTATLLTAVAVFCLWYVFYPQQMASDEQTTLFVWDKAFLSQYISTYGWTKTIKAFVAQFFYHPMQGALVIACASAALQWLCWLLLQKICRKSNKAVKAVLFILSFLPTIWFNFQVGTADAGTAEEQAYDLLLRKSDWDGIIKKSQTLTPTSPACRNAVALARYFKGYGSADEVFRSLTPTSQALTSKTAAQMMSDIYLFLGLPNLSQRAAFEAMEEGWNGRALHRLVETALITGQYEVAGKYLGLLRHTLGYRKWALQTLPLLNHPEAIDQHPFYGKIRRMYTETQDQFFL